MGALQCRLATSTLPSLPLSATSAIVILRSPRRILKDGYDFRCNCPLCKNLQRDKELYSFKCRCGGAMLPTIEDGSKRPGRVFSVA